MKGHQVDLYEAQDKLGGKLQLCIPRQRLPQEVLRKELSRFQEIGVRVHLRSKVNRRLFDRIYKEHDVVVVACGAHKPRRLKFPGSEHTVAAFDFLRGINLGQAPQLEGSDVVVIGAGNVGMDVAMQAFHCGARSVVAVDIQRPAAFGKELEMAQSLGTKILWPKFTQRYEPKERRLYFTDGSSLPADLVVVAIGETPLVDFLPQSVHRDKAGWIEVNELYQSTDPKVYAIGDATRAGLVTHAIGAGREAAEVIHSELMHYDYMPEIKEPIAYERIKTVYYEACTTEPGGPAEEAQRCLSCATCRDCHMCEATCYWGAIYRVELQDGSFQYKVDEERCIGCGFCAGVCPCGVWEMVENI
jgi:NADPH-dependent glutamate synthase beta subunit-like oxidoreductase/NAD-dependent dihydropyrimidine dehydrogenase PreA subunit